VKSSCYFDIINLEGSDLAMMEFLYFPNDKSEYIPAIITFVVFLIGAIVTTLYFIKKSRKEEKDFDEQYMRVTIEKDEQTSKK